MSAPTTIAGQWVASRPTRARNRAVATADVVLGTLLVSVGVGLGLPWAARTGVSPMAATGLLALVCGVVVWVSGLRALTRRAGRRARWALVPPVLVGSLLLIYVVALPLMVVAPPPSRLGPATPADRGLVYHAVQMPGADGTTLEGWYVPTANGAAVVLRHGSGATRTAVLDQAAVLARHGYGVLMTDARGYGQSTGQRMAWGWYGEEDIQAAVHLLVRTPGVDPDRIGVVGLSMGGEEALGAAAHDARIRAVVAEGLTGRGAADLGWLPATYGWRGEVTLMVHRVQTALVDLLSDAPSPTPLADAVAQTAPRQVLLVTAGEVPDELHAARALAARSPATVQVWVVPGSGHTQGLRTAPQAWERHVVAFLDAALDSRLPR